MHRAILCNDAVHAALVCTRVHVLTVRRHTATIQDMLELGRHQTSTSEQTTTTITTTTTTTTVGVRLSCFFLLDVHMHIRVCVCVCGRGMDVLDTVRLRPFSCLPVWSLTVRLTCWYQSVIFPYALGWYHDNGEGGRSSSGFARVSSCQLTCTSCIRTR